MATIICLFWNDIKRDIRVGVLFVHYMNLICDTSGENQTFSGKNLRANQLTLKFPKQFDCIIFQSFFIHRELFDSLQECCNFVWSSICVITIERLYTLWMKDKSKLLKKVPLAIVICYQLPNFIQNTNRTWAWGKGEILG